MFEYVIRRLLLMIPTFFGTTLLVFMILQSVPSGPFEQAVMQIKLSKMYSTEGQTMESRSSDDKNTMELSEKVLEKLRMQYGPHKAISDSKENSEAASVRPGSRPKAASLKLQALRAPSSKLQAPSNKPQASSHKPQAPRNWVNGGVWTSS